MDDQFPKREMLVKAMLRLYRLVTAKNTSRRRGFLSYSCPSLGIWGVKYWGKTWKIGEPGTATSYFLPLPLLHSKRPRSSLSSTLPLPIFQLYGQLVAISAIWHQNTIKISHNTSASQRQSCSQSANRSNGHPSSCEAEEGRKPSYCYNCRPDPAWPKESQMHLGLVWESKKNQIPKGPSRPRPWMRTGSRTKTKPVSEPGLWPVLWEGQSGNSKSLMLSPVFTWLSIFLSQRHLHQSRPRLVALVMLAMSRGRSESGD